MSTSPEIQRLAALMEDLARELHQAVSSHQRDNRTIMLMLEEAVDVAKSNAVALKKHANSQEQRDEDRDDDEGSFWIHLKPNTLAKIIPWVLAVGSALIGALSHIHGG